MAQYVTAPVEGIETPVAREGDRYRPEDHPLQRVLAAQGDACVMFYYCDQIGAPLMMTDEAGESWIDPLGIASTLDGGR